MSHTSLSCKKCGAPIVGQMESLPPINICSNGHHTRDELSSAPLTPLYSGIKYMDKSYSNTDDIQCKFCGGKIIMSTNGIPSSVVCIRGHSYEPKNQNTKGELISSLSVEDRFKTQKYTPASSPWYADQVMNPDMECASCGSSYADHQYDPKRGYGMSHAFVSKGDLRQMDAIRRTPIRRTPI